MKGRAGRGGWTILAGLIGGIGVLGCGGEPTAPRACNRPIQVTATRGTTPTFTWTPACGVTDVVVETVPAAGGVPTWVWHVAVPESAPFGPGVRYGVAPRGAETRTPAQPLVPGATYRVYAQVVIGGDAVAARGSVPFTP